MSDADTAAAFFFGLLAFGAVVIWFSVRSQMRESELRVAAEAAKRQNSVGKRIIGRLVYGSTPEHYAGMRYYRIYREFTFTGHVIATTKRAVHLRIDNPLRKFDEFKLMEGPIWLPYWDSDSGTFPSIIIDDVLDEVAQLDTHEVAA